MTGPDAPLPQPPLAPREPVVLDLHGVQRVDDYGWLRDLDRPQTMAYLTAERDYHDAVSAHSRPFRQRLYDEMVRRTPSTDESVSWRAGGTEYHTRTLPGKEYEQFLRKNTADSSVEVLLDENLIADGADFFALGVREVSPDGGLLAYSVDREGDEVYALRIRVLRTGEDLPEVMPRTYYGAAWSADSTVLFYVVHDAAYRPFQVWRHTVGTDPGSDVLVFTEQDDRFELVVQTSRSGGYVVILTGAKDSTEVWLVPTGAPAEPARVVQPRVPGLEYTVAHAPEPGGPDRLLILTNDGAPEFRLMRTPVDAPGREHWEELVGEHPAERLHAVDVFAGHAVLSLRRDGSPVLRILPRDGSGTAIDLHPGIEAGVIRLEPNPEYAATSVLVAVESCTEPTTWYDVDLATGARTLRKRREAPGYDPAAYRSERFAVEARDGELVPVTVVHHVDTPLDGTAPCLLYGYGAYEDPFEGEFDAPLPSLLDRGVVFAHAHVRGGGDLGRRWYRHGSLEHKQNTFSDFVDVADGLAGGVVDGDRLVCRGLSAGGLLMGAVFSQAPRRWAGVVAEVPFVDVVTTMLDESIPLTAQEWDEWGDPRRPEDFAWMLGYSPYDNVPPVADRPRMLVTGAVHDARVMYWEPAKWVAKLRATGSTDERLTFRIELGAGAHSGPSGRFGHLHYEAEVYAWILEALGVEDGAAGRSARR
jgi:oligopeptidase B